MPTRLIALLVFLLPTLAYAADEKSAAPANAPKAAAPAAAPAAKKPARRSMGDADARHCLEENKDNLSIARCAERYR